MEFAFASPDFMNTKLPFGRLHSSISFFTKNVAPKARKDLSVCAFAKIQQKINRTNKSPNTTLNIVLIILMLFAFSANSYTLQANHYGLFQNDSYLISEYAYRYEGYAY